MDVDEFCFICGKKLVRRFNLTKTKTTAICGSEKCVKIYFEKTAESHKYLNKTETINGHCRLCGKPHVINFYTKMYSHRECSIEKNKNKNVKRKPYLIPKKQIKHHIKPWEDPESLFCDTEFLKQIVGKDIADGDECKELYISKDA